MTLTRYGGSILTVWRIRLRAVLARKSRLRLLDLRTRTGSPILLFLQESKWSLSRR